MDRLTDHTSIPEVDAAVMAATAAASRWAGTAPADRMQVLSRWADLIGEHREELATTASTDMRKLIHECRAEVDRTVAEIQFCAGEALRSVGSTYPSNAPGVSISSVRVPVGVVAAITPWNFPLLAPARKIAPALAFGNTVVLKPSEESPASALALASLLTEAGLPDGALGVVAGAGAAGAALVAHPGVDAVTFTGSTRAGRSIALGAAERLVPVQLELGGKNAAYVHASADLDRAVDEIVAAATQSSGQRCTAISRVVVDEAIADEVTARLAARFDALTYGSDVADGPGDIGPLVSTRQKERVDALVEGAAEEGASLATTRHSSPGGDYVAPVVLDHVTPAMTIAQEEVFGPVVVVMRVTTPAEAVEVVNASAYGLAAAVFATDIAVAFAFVEGVRVGMVHVNHGTSSQHHVPFGGVGDSGLGAFSIGHDQQDFFTVAKVVYVRP